MKFMSLKAITLAILALLSFKLSAVIISLTHFAPTKDRPEVLILGDSHESDESGREHFDLLKDYLDKWAKQQDQMLFLLEDSDQAYEAFTKKTLPQLIKQNFGVKPFMGLLYELSFYARSKFKGKTQTGKPAFRHGKVRFCFADDRGKGLQNLIDFMGIIDQDELIENHKDKLREALAFTDFDSYEPIRTALEEYLKKMHQKIFTTYSICIQEFLDELDKNLENMLQYNNEFDRDPSAYKTLNELYLVAKNSRNIAEIFFKKEQADLTGNFMNSFINVCTREMRQNFEDAYKFLKNYKDTVSEEAYLDALNNENNSTLLNAFKKMGINSLLIGQSLEDALNTWMTPLLTTICNHGFIKRIINNAKNFKKIVLFCGNDHAIEIKNALISGFGYKKPTIECGLQKNLSLPLSNENDEINAKDYIVNKEALSKYLNTIFVPATSGSIATSHPSTTPTSSASLPSSTCAASGSDTSSACQSSNTSPVSSSSSTNASSSSPSTASSTNSTTSGFRTGFLCTAASKVTTK